MDSKSSSAKARNFRGEAIKEWDIKKLLLQGPDLWNHLNAVQLVCSFIHLCKAVKLSCLWSRKQVRSCSCKSAAAQSITHSTDQCTETIWEIHLLPAVPQTWRKKLIALNNKTLQSLPYSSHRKSGLKINACFTSFCFLIFFIFEPNVEMNLRHNLFMWLQHDHPTQTQTQTCLSLDLQLPEVGREGTRSHMPGTLQESASQSVFPRHRLLGWPVLTQVCPWRREWFLKLSQKLSPARGQRCEAHSKRKALRAPSLCVTGEPQVRDWRIAEISSQATPIIKIQNTARRKGKN